MKWGKAKFTIESTQAYGRPKLKSVVDLIKDEVCEGRFGRTFKVMANEAYGLSQIAEPTHTGLFGSGDVLPVQRSTTLTGPQLSTAEKPNRHDPSVNLREGHQDRAAIIDPVQPDGDAHGGETARPWKPAAPTEYAPAAVEKQGDKALPTVSRPAWVVLKRLVKSPTPMHRKDFAGKPDPGDRVFLLPSDEETIGDYLVAVAGAVLLRWE